MHRFVTSAVDRARRCRGATAATASSCPAPPSRCASAAHGRGATPATGSPSAASRWPTGPSASGESIASYGANSVSNSIARDNGHYGIEILGGLDVGVQNNQVEGSDMGIVARQGAARSTITGNRLTGQRRQGIADPRRGHRGDRHRQRHRRRRHRRLRPRLGRRGARQHHPGRRATTASTLVGEVGGSVVVVQRDRRRRPERAGHRPRRRARSRVRENQTVRLARHQLASGSSSGTTRAR